MVNRSVSMSQRPFSDGDYVMGFPHLFIASQLYSLQGLNNLIPIKDDGQIHRLTPGSRLWESLYSQPWLNCSEETKNRFLARLSSQYYYLGYIISTKRSQIELTIVPFNSYGTGPGIAEMLSITLPNVSQYLPS